ncbi:MAG: hypothetical protein JWO23_1328 [Solirubrobacterales bacterium]|nr:hypothetical protein [Solirubrobacterales bacterium]
MLQLLSGDTPPAGPAENATGPDQGVIEEARRRQRRRRIHVAVATVTVAALVGAIAWMLAGGASRAEHGHGFQAGATATVRSSDPHVAAFDVRVVPWLSVGRAGWCLVVEEHGVAGVSACGDVPERSMPVLDVLGWSYGGSRHETQVAVTDPQVAAVLVGGTRRVSTVPLAGLPYGMRGARILAPAGSTLVALDRQGHQMTQHWSNTPRQGSVRSWRYPSRPPQGACRLVATGLPGIAARGGEVASAIRSFRGQLVGYAFLPCMATTYYLQHEPLRATVVLDAAHPGAHPAMLPDFKPVRRARGFFAEGGAGGLTARRSQNAWLIVGQGTGAAQRIRLLRHLTATVRL